MTQREILKRSIDELIEDYPIADRLPNWFFCGEEVSNNAWRAEGSDFWGRKVSRSGGDPDVLLATCIEDSRRKGLTCGEFTRRAAGAMLGARQTQQHGRTGGPA